MTAKNEVNETTITMLHQSASLFFTMLPPEIRDAIYCLALVIWSHEDTIGYYRYARVPCMALFKDGVKGPLLGMLLARKRAYHELPRDLLAGFSICITKRPAGDPMLFAPWTLSSGKRQLEKRKLGQKVAGIGAYGNMPLDKRRMLTIFIDEALEKGLNFGGVIGIFSCVMFAAHAKKATWRLRFPETEGAYLEKHWDRLSGYLKTGSVGRFNEVAPGVKTLVLTWPPAGSDKREKELTQS